MQMTTLITLALTGFATGRRSETATEGVLRPATSSSESSVQKVPLPCIFPFTFRNTVHNDCTRDHDPERRLWCSTQTDGEGKHVQGGWRYCKEQPTPAPTPAPATPAPATPAPAPAPATGCTCRDVHGTELRDCSGTGNTWLSLPVDFHLAPNMAVNVGLRHLNSWIDESDVTGALIKDVNAIYKDACIRFVATVTTEHCVGRARQHSCASVAGLDATQTSSGTFTSHRATKVIVETQYRSSQTTKFLVRDAVYSQLPTTNWDVVNHKEFHVWLVPYIGKQSQGRANRARKWGAAVTIGLWSDKYTSSPVRRAISGAHHRKEGSLATTVAHELGHTLGLHHGPREDLLMQAGVDVKFTAEQIRTSRIVAAEG